MKIILDNIIYSLQESGGISVYWTEIIKRALLDSSILNLKFVGDKNTSKNIFRQNLIIKECLILNSNNSLISRIRKLPLKINEKTTFHSSYYRIADNNLNSVSNIVTVHDFIQEKYNKSKLNLNSLMKRSAIKNADFIITISENTKSDLLYYYPKIDEKNIKVIYNGISDEFYELGNLEKSNFILFVGSRVNYKNFSFAIDVVSKLKDTKLYIVGSPLLKTELSTLNKKLGTNWLNFVFPTNLELNILYNQAKCLIYPSFYEGFGIPILEAMRCGCPVISLNNSSITEIAGGMAILHDNLSLDDFVDSIDNLKTIDTTKAINYSKQFSWDNTYKETKIIYDKFN